MELCYYKLMYEFLNSLINLETLSLPENKEAHTYNQESTLPLPLLTTSIIIIITVWLAWEHHAAKMDTQCNGVVWFSGRVLASVAALK